MDRSRLPTLEEARSQVFDQRARAGRRTEPDKRDRWKIERRRLWDEYQGERQRRRAQQWSEQRQREQGRRAEIRKAFRTKRDKIKATPMNVAERRASDATWCRCFKATARLSKQACGWRKSDTVNCFFKSPSEAFTFLVDTIQDGAFRLYTSDLLGSIGSVLDKHIAGDNPIAQILLSATLQTVLTSLGNYGIWVGRNSDSTTMTQTAVRYIR